MLKIAGCLLTVAFTLYLAVMYDPVWLFDLVIAEVIFFAVCAVTGFCFARHIRVQFQTDALIMEKGKETAIHVRALNRSAISVPRIRIVVELNDNGKKERYAVSGAIGSRAVKLFELKVTPKFCGELKMRVVEINTWDYFRLFKWRKTLKHTEVTIHVLPRILPAAAEVVSNFRYFIGDSDVYSDEESGDDPSQIFEIRDYRPGDKMQKIHWKLSAKSDSLIVKEYSEPVGFAIVIFVNLFSPGKKEDRQKRDAVLETAASLSWTLIEQNYTHIVAWVGERGRIRRRKISDYEDIYEMLAGLLTAKPHEYDRPARKLYGEKYGEHSYHSMIEVNMAMEIKLRENLAAVIDPTQLEQSLLNIQLEI